MEMALSVVGVGVKRDAEGRYCVNDLHRAAGGEKRHTPSYWLANTQTIEMIDLLNTGIPAIKPLITIRGRTGGTFVTKPLVYSYAMWVSAEFNLSVINAVDEIATKAVVAFDLNDPEVLRSKLLDYTNIVIEHKRTISLLTEEKIVMEGKNVKLTESIEILLPIAKGAGLISKTQESMCYTDAAKHLGIIPYKKLKEWLLKHKWAHERGKKLKTYREAEIKGYVEMKLSKYPDPITGEEKSRSSFLVTGKGLQYLATIFALEAEAA